ncbi:MAG TPA: hypothetical protein VLG38_03555 [Gammaproteobacteria bacterium]|nr:hypothetical protein [Gammaproteobacteria bacterium]
MRFVLIFLFTFYSTYALGSEIYKCAKLDGSTFYRDTPCRPTDPQAVLRYTELPITQQEINTLQSSYNKQQNAAFKARHRTLREVVRAQKQQQLEQRRHLRLKAKCETVLRQIEQLHARYRQGYTAKQGVSLDRKLAECKFRQNKYCN